VAISKIILEIFSFWWQ